MKEKFKTVAGKDIYKDNSHRALKDISQEVTIINQGENDMNNCISNYKILEVLRKKN